MAGILGGAVKGFVGRTVSGLAMGFASGFSGKMGLTEFLNTLWQSALIGAITGGDITQLKESVGEDYESFGSVPGRLLGRIARSRRTPNGEAQRSADQRRECRLHRPFDGRLSAYGSAA
jgi:hypothetical protein